MEGEGEGVRDGMGNLGRENRGGREMKFLFGGFYFCRERKRI